jgi:ParB-like chromosome segregation protein Spo0J
MNGLIEKLVAELGALDLDARVEALNKIREALHDVSPFKEEPVDFVRWVKSDTVSANAWNPNHVAPPEMKLLELSIVADGYTQPVVGYAIESGYEVVDGFHRNLVAKTSPQVRERVKGYLPIVRIKSDREDKGDRMAATIRHNRARGKHEVMAMSTIVADLIKRNWSESRVATELGMSADEVLRLRQVTGLAELFADREFSEAWEIVEDTPE